MKRKLKKLNLERETVKALSAKQLDAAAAGAVFSLHSCGADICIGCTRRRGAAKAR